MVMKHKPSSEHEFRIVPAGEFKAKCLQLMDEVSEKRNLTIIITKRGRPVAQMSAPPAGLKLSGPTVEMLPDTYAAAIVSPLDGPASAAFEQHRHKKHKGKKKRK
jgi:antitoxin (DNA-binding transcriptional repressor) of toxin-antitoxin stability system